LLEGDAGIEVGTDDEGPLFGFELGGPSVEFGAPRFQMGVDEIDEGRAGDLGVVLCPGVKSGVELLRAREEAEEESEEDESTVVAG
jgi:hypothetical protein